MAGQQPTQDPPSTVTTTASSPVFPGATKWAAMRSGVVSAPVADVAAFLEFDTALEKIAPPIFVDAEITYAFEFDIAICEPRISHTKYVSERLPLYAFF